MRQEFDGIYGRWKVDEDDIREVNLYRYGLTITSVSITLCLGISLANYNNIQQFNGLLDPLCGLGALSFGLSLYLIHIYVTPIKRFIQALWFTGLVGGTYLGLTQSEPIVIYTQSHNDAVWLIGPIFAALTGVGVKEGLCYGKKEAFGTALITPVLLLEHLVGIFPTQLEYALTLIWTALILQFTLSKYKQNLKDDIGDKSVFTFQKLDQEKQEALIRELQSNQ